MSSDRVYLDVPYPEKDVCRRMGGHWDKPSRCWYVPDDTSPAPFLQLWSQKTVAAAPPPPNPPADRLHRFADALEQTAYVRQLGKRLDRLERELELQYGAMRASSAFLLTAGGKRKAEDAPGLQIVYLERAAPAGEPLVVSLPPRHRPPQPPPPPNKAPADAPKSPTYDTDEPDAHDPIVQEGDKK